jgi:hypothetical protein
MYRGRSATTDEQFLDQFEMDGSDWLFRYKMTGPAYRVTDREKDRLIAAYQRARRRYYWWLAFMATICLMLIVGTLAVPQFEPWLREIVPDSIMRYLSTILLTLTFGIQWTNEALAFRLPLKALAKRTPVAPAWSREDQQRFALDRLPLAIVVGTVTISFLVLLYFILERPSIGPISVALIVASVVALAWASVQGYRKWQFARADAVVTSPTT